MIRATRALARRSAANAAASFQWRTTQQVAGLRTVNISLESFFIVQTFDEKQFFAIVVQRLQDLPEFHVLAGTLCPPVVFVKSVARKQHCQTNGGLACSGCCTSLLAPDSQRFHPWQCHRNAQSAEHGSTRCEKCSHI